MKIKNIEICMIELDQLINDLMEKDSIEVEKLKTNPEYEIKIFYVYKFLNNYLNKTQAVTIGVSNSSYIKNKFKLVKKLIETLIEVKQYDMKDINSWYQDWCYITGMSPFDEEDVCPYDATEESESHGILVRRGPSHYKPIPTASGGN